MKSNFEWKKWGETDPLYAVATWEGKERGGVSAWTDEEFYELGRSDWGDFHSQWQQYGLTRDHCLEIGCGAGRITRQLALLFSRVSAADVSAHQLEYARRHIPSKNVDFFLIDGLRYPVPDRSCDAVFSVHVFQHFESYLDALQVFREVHRMLRPGGSFMIHLPVYVLPDMKLSRCFRPVIAWSKRASDLKAAMDRRAMARGQGQGVMRRLRFEREPLAFDLDRIGFTQIEFRAFSVRSNRSWHDFILGRRPS